MKKIVLFFAISLLSFTEHAQKPDKLPPGWKTINGCGVSLDVPVDIVFLEDQSVDTCERIYRGKNISLHITATEWNVGQGDYANWSDHCVSKIRFGSKQAEIVSSMIPILSGGSGSQRFAAMLLAADFLHDGRDLRIHTSSTTEKERNEALRILRSVRAETLHRGL